MSARLLLAAAIVLGSVTGAQAHIDRARQTFTYGVVNAANEYASIDDDPLTYDAAGNLTVDEDGRQYFYDEFNRLTEVRTSGNAVLVRYTYDALGRRVLSEFSPNDPPNAYTIRYVYDGQRIIEERDGADALTFYHVNGAQYIDERVATYEVPGATAGAGGFTYYLAGSNYSVTGKGNSDGSVIERIDFGSGGDFAKGPAGSFAHDAEPDLDIDLADFASLQVCFGTTDPTCLDIHDFDLDGVADGVIDIDDFDAFVQCMNGPEVPPLPGCAVAPTLRNGTPPPPGTFALHGWPIETLPDGKTLLHVRARVYDPQHGRWLQRDPSGYADGANLYESFGSNATRNVDPAGRKTYVFGGTAYNERGDTRSLDEIRLESSLRLARKDPEGAVYIRGVGAPEGFGAAHAPLIGRRYSDLLNSPGLLLGHGTDLRVERMYNKICDDVCSDSPPKQINILGWSRGAIAAVLLADKLAREGCYREREIPNPDFAAFNDPITKVVRKQVTNVQITFLGLYDPVDRRPGSIPAIPANVRSVAIAVAEDRAATWFPACYGWWQMFPAAEIRSPNSDTRFDAHIVTGTARKLLSHADPFPRTILSHRLFAGTTHSDIGLGEQAARWMEDRAREAGMNLSGASVLEVLDVE